MADTPTSRTLKRLRSEGWTAAVVEKWNPHVKIRQDLYGIIDIVAIRGDECLGVQATSGSNAASRVKKLQESPNTAVWLGVPHHRLEVWGWRRLKNKRWEPRVTVIERDGE